MLLTFRKKIPVIFGPAFVCVNLLVLLKYFRIFFVQETNSNFDTIYGVVRKTVYTNLIVTNYITLLF